MANATQVLSAFGTFKSMILYPDLCIFFTDQNGLNADAAILQDYDGNDILPHITDDTKTFIYCHQGHQHPVPVLFMRQLMALVNDARISRIPINIYTDKGELKATKDIGDLLN